MKKTLLTAIMIVAVLAAGAQSPTTVTDTNTCRTFANFNNSNEGFSSPSIYSDANDVSFTWNAGAGAYIESSGLMVRTASLISPIYVQSVQGSASVGFRFAAPAGTEYRIRVISSVTSPPQEILATTANGPVFRPLPGLSGNICVQLTDADIDLGRQVRFEFTFRSNQPGNILFDDLAVAAATLPLSVAFEGFVGRNNSDGSIKLLWNVGTEINIRGYYVESSTNGLDFLDKGFVTANGKSIYGFDNPGKLVQTTYFRVRSVDLNGSVKYTPIIKINTQQLAGFPMQVYPVPATDLVTIQHNPLPVKALLTLTSPNGNVLQKVIAAPNTFQTQMNVKNLPAGIYIVSLSDGTSVQSTRLVKY